MKKKTLLSRITEKIKPESSSYEQQTIVPHGGACVSESYETIISRRNELRAAKHDNLDAMVTFKKNN